MADAPTQANGAQMTRRDRTKPEPSFTAVRETDQPSAWARGALYGGGLTLMAITLGLGFTILRPTPRRRRPELPAPAHCHTRGPRQ